MSSFYDDASLVVIPSGYKTSKVYAEKPTDGSGDLAFTRTGDTATRVNSAGLIEKVRTNLVTFSEDFANAAWTKNNATVTSNTQANPVNGAVTADTITATASVGYINSAAIALSAIPYTISMYAKKSNVDWFSIEVSDGVANSAKSWYNIANGTLGTTGGTYTITGRTITSAGNGWYRCTLTFNVTSATNYSFIPFFVASDGALSVNGNAGFGFGAQVETTDFGATPYIPTLTAAVSTGPTANVPRLDYLGSTCPRLLLEPQRTNLVTYSEQLNNAAWLKLGITVSANNTLSPSGYLDADKLIADAGTGNRVVYQSVVPAGVSTVSTYAKAGEFGGIVIANGTQGAFFNLITGAYRTFYGSAPTAYSITSVGNGWYRCSVTFTSASTDNLYIGPNDNVSTTLAITGNGTSGTYVWGAQLEGSNSSYPTSYIPTLAASATRGADACSKTGISSLIGQTEGVVYSEFQYFDNIAGTAELVLLYIGNGAFTAGIYFSVYQDILYAVIWDGAVQQALINCGALTAGVHKIAIAYKQNDIAVYLNGVLKGTDTAATIPTCAQVFLGTAGSSTSIEAYKTLQALLFKTRLTNAQLAELTTL